LEVVSRYLFVTVYFINLIANVQRSCPRSQPNWPQRLAIRRMRVNTYIFVPHCCRNLIAHTLRTYTIAYVL